MKAKIKYFVLSELRFKNVFPILDQSHLENEYGSEDLHSTQLMEMVITKYLDIRMYSYGKFFEQNVLKRGKIGVRQHSNKLVLFKGL